MSRTANLRRQHDAAVALVTEAAALIEQPGLAQTDHYRIGILIAKLTGLLRVHFALEDRTLYPLMIRSTHDGAAATARAFQDEMGGLAGVYLDFAERWATSAKIGADFARFQREARAVFAALGDRITRENEELYPLADAIGYDQIRMSA